MSSDVTQELFCGAVRLTALTYALESSVSACTGLAESLDDCTLLVAEPVFDTWAFLQGDTLDAMLDVSIRTVTSLHTTDDGSVGGRITVRIVTGRWYRISAGFVFRTVVTLNGALVLMTPFDAVASSAAILVKSRDGVTQALTVPPTGTRAAVLGAVFKIFGDFRFPNELPTSAEVVTLGDDFTRPVGPIFPVWNQFTGSLRQCAFDVVAAVCRHFPAVAHSVFIVGCHSFLGLHIVVGVLVKIATQAPHVAFPISGGSDGHEQTSTPDDAHSLDSDHGVEGIGYHAEVAGGETDGGVHGVGDVVNHDAPPSYQLDVGFLVRDFHHARARRPGSPATNLRGADCKRFAVFVRLHQDVRARAREGEGVTVERREPGLRSRHEARSCTLCLGGLVPHGVHTGLLVAAFGND